MHLESGLKRREILLGPDVLRVCIQIGLADFF
jgi:hypothetical protein